MICDTTSRFDEKITQSCKLEPAERETFITYNEADAEEGYISVYTTIAADARRLVKRVGSDSLIDVKVTTFQGKPFAWDFKLPLKLYGKAFFGIKKQGP